MDLDEVADALYALPRDEFTRARDERAKQARAEGERELSTAIGRLRRPTVAAWLVNQVARQRPERLAELAELGEALRGAHARLDGAELRRLSGRRRELVAGLVGLARELGERSGAPVSEAVGRELEDIFAAALTAPGAARAVTGGRLVSPKELAEAGGDGGVEGADDAGMGGLAWPSVAPGTRPRPAPARTSEPSTSAASTSAASTSESSTSETSTGTRSTSERSISEPAASEPATSGPAGPSAAVLRARRELDRTEAAVADAEGRHAAARRAYDEAEAEEHAAHQAVADRRAELLAAERAERDARQRARAARREREDTDRALRDALRRRAVAQDRLTALEA